MKKVLAIVLVVCVVCSAGAVFAQPKQQQQPQQQRRQDPRQLQQRFDDNWPCFCGREFWNGRDNRDCRDQPQPQPNGRFDNRPGEMRGRMMFAPDMTPEIRAKVVEIAKLRIDLDEALSSRPINKAKALDIHAKIQKAEQELEAWKFAAMIDRIEKGETLQGRRAPLPPKMPAPAPEKPEPAPESEAPAPEK